MNFDFKEAYDIHYTTYIENYFKDFEEDLLHAPEPQYFITIFQEKSKKLKSNTHQQSQLYSIISEIDNQLSLSDRISFIDLVRNYCNETDRDFLQTLYYIAEIKALDEIWLTAQRRRGKLNYDKLDSPVLENKSNSNIIIGNSQETILKPDVTYTPVKITALNLIDFFHDPSQYEFIKTKLVEEGFCKHNSFIWIPQGRGNFLMLCALLYILDTKGYYKPGTPSTLAFRKKIAQDTFGVNISLPTFKSKNFVNYLGKFDFIPGSEKVIS